MSRRLLLLEEGGGPEPVSTKVKYGFAVLDNMTPIVSATRIVSFADLGWVDGSSTQTLALASKELTGYTYVKANNECILVSKVEGTVSYSDWSTTTNKRVNKFGNICIKTSEFVNSGSTGQVYTDPNTTTTTSWTPYYNIHSNLYEYYSGGQRIEKLYINTASTTSVNTYPIKLLFNEMSTSNSASSATATFLSTLVLQTHANYMASAEIPNIVGASSYLTVTNEVYITDKMFSSIVSPLVLYNS